MPAPDASPTTGAVPSRPWIALVGASGAELRVLERALALLVSRGAGAPDLATVTPGKTSGAAVGWWPSGDDSATPESTGGPGRPAGAILVVADPTACAGELAGNSGLGEVHGLAVWERFYRTALARLRLLPVLVTSLPEAVGDPAGWADALGAFLSLIALDGCFEPSSARLRAVLGPHRTNSDVKDEGLMLESQRQMAALLEQLLGRHDAFDPPPPEPESPWVTSLLNAARDLAQTWEGLDWAAARLASLVPTPRYRPAPAWPEPYPLNASEDLAAYHRWLERRGEPRVLPLHGGLPTGRARRHAKAPLLFSVVVPVLRPPPWALERCVASVLSQSFTDFQLVLADDASDDAGIEEQLRSFAALDARVEIVHRGETGGISAATNSAIERARGEFLVFVDHDDELHPEALAEMASAIAANPDADVLYSDEDKLSPSGERCVPSLKPDWSPDLLLSSAYFCHLLVVRRFLVVELGGLRSQFDGSQDYDLMLRATEVARSVVHVPEILYHWRVLDGSVSLDPHAKPWAFAAERRALEAALERRAIAAVVEPHRFAGNFHLRREVSGGPLVSIIVPFRDEPEMTASCYRSLVASPGYDRYEILLVDNASELPETAALLSQLAGEENVRVINDPRPFDWVAINNAAAAEARGEVLLFLNNDIEARSEGWLAAMLGHAEREEVGAVGALLRYPDMTVQHAGIVVGMSFGAAHVLQGLPHDRAGYMLLTETTRNCSAVTGACLMTRRGCFEEVGGFDPALPVAFNDVDYCLRLRQRGLLVVYTPLAEMIHLESQSRGHADDIVETPIFRMRWKDELLSGDPYYNPNLSRFEPYCRLSTEEESELWNVFRSMLGASSTS